MSAVMNESVVISRQEARAQGLKRFFTGVPCKHGHIAVRIVRNYNCIACAAITQRHRLGGRPSTPRPIRSAPVSQVKRRTRQEYNDERRGAARMAARMAKMQERSAKVTREAKARSPKAAAPSDGYLTPKLYAQWRREKEQGDKRWAAHVAAKQARLAAAESVPRVKPYLVTLSSEHLRRHYSDNFWGFTPDPPMWSDDGGAKRVGIYNHTFGQARLVRRVGWTTCLGSLPTHRIFSYDVARERICTACKGMQVRATTVD
jgi:hypothetical protein